MSDAIEGNDFDHDGFPDRQSTGTDTDGDGLDDGFEGSNLNDPFDVNDEIGDPSNDLPNRDQDLENDPLFADIVEGDVEPDYRDIDDDGDGDPTLEEDTDEDGDYTNDDCNFNTVPDYLDPCYHVISCQMVSHQMMMAMMIPL